jgi:hypothetical protein
MTSASVSEATDDRPHEGLAQPATAVDLAVEDDVTAPPIRRFGTFRGIVASGR